MRITIQLVDHIVTGFDGEEHAVGVRSTISAEDWPLLHETVEQRDEAEIHYRYPGCFVDIDWWTPPYTLTYDTEDLGYCE